MLSGFTPVIVGVGQAVDRLDDPAYHGWSAADLAAEALRRAGEDAGQGALASLGALAAIRTFEDSVTFPAVFGKPAKFPRAVAARLGLSPAITILAKAGGQTPLAKLVDLAERILAGQIEAGAVVGAEAISTVRHLKARGDSRNWAEDSDGTMEDEGRGAKGLVNRRNTAHGIQAAPVAYGLLENARRARLGLSREDYAREMGALFAPFTRVAAANPYASAAASEMTVEEITTVTERNRMVADPYPVKLVSRDQVNQGAAVIVMSIEKARALRIDESRWIYLHGCALADERDIIERPDPGASPAAALALRTALQRAGRTTADIDHFDFYSCFPIAVFASAVDALGLSPDDPRDLTVTGGLAYFGGPGNNYSTHAFATMVERLRAQPGTFGLVAVNGGFLSKYGAAVLSTSPAEWTDCPQAELQEELDKAPRPQVAREPVGEGRILTYTLAYTKGVPSRGVIIGELRSGERFIANEADPETLAAMVAEDPIGRTVHVCATPLGNRFAFDAVALAARFARPAPRLRDGYEHVLVARRGHVLEVTINRPDVRNCLSPVANDELDEIFDAFEADAELWVAILTGAGSTFCAGADLKWQASGKPSWMPRGGFAGITSRVGRTKPIIAAVSGTAFGGGFETCLAADMVVADPAARFALSEVKVGVIAAAGGIARLTRQIPRKIALELLLTGRPFGVEEARAIGIVNHVSAAGEVLAEARRLADEIAAVSPTSVRLTMQMIHELDAFPNGDEAARAAVHSPALDDLATSDDMIEGLTAFAQKRAPHWKNR
jgi:acetyl-CoA C-acetyltransferase